jgi:NitT/TauT family transport system substrate-binding protein
LLKGLSLFGIRPSVPGVRNLREKDFKMKKTIIGLAVGALALSASAAMAGDAVTLQLKWVTQAQFAGYFVAQDMGFYEEEGIDITIKSGGPDVAPEQVIAGGGADVIVDWMGGALAAREKGVGLVNIAQPFKNAGLLMICPKDGPVQSEADFPGHTLGVWFYGNEYPFYAWMNKLGIPTEGGADGVNVLKQSFDVEPLIQGQADCISVMTYNELGQAIDAGFSLDKLVIFNYSDLDNDLLEDGLYALESDLADPAFADKMVRFTRASQKGWQYAVDHPEEAAQIIIDNDESGAQTLEHQLYMMGEVAKLVDPSDFSLDGAAYARTEQALLDQNIIENKPEGAYTSAITDAL